MPDIIKLLPDSVANQIAAGEVIQRPASVVKELMENSVDAGSNYIRVIIKDAGSSLVQVIDDGTGMSETDSRLSFERHATSKINTAEDLFAISTKGFRGEALASIAAVAMVELKSCLHENEIGTMLKINGSKVELQEPASCPPGTNIAVKNLFYNVPARRKFLKTPSTEMRHIINEFQKIVLAHPDIRFSLHHNDKELFNLLRSNERQRILAVFGKNMNQNLINLHTETSLVKISGYTGKPENARKTFGEQFFFINNRYMRHPYLHKAVMEAYEKILPPDSIPSYFIFLHADPATIAPGLYLTEDDHRIPDLIDQHLIYKRPVGIQLADSGPRPFATGGSTALDGPADSLGVHTDFVSNVFDVDTLVQLCLNVHPVLLVEHRPPPGLLADSQR